MPLPALAWLLPGITLLLFWPLSDTAADRALFLSLNTHAGLLPDAFWSGLTLLGDSLVALCLLLFLLRRRPDLVTAALFASLPALLLSHGLKDGLAVPRPLAVLGDGIHVVGPPLKAGSFPSGHTTTAFLLAGVLVLGIRTRGTAAIVLILAALAGLSRIAVGAHWPRDILGGILCGWLSGLVGLYLAHRLPLHERPGVLAAMRFFLLVCALVLLTGYDTGHPWVGPLAQTLALTALACHLLPGWRLPDVGGRRA